MKKLSTVGVKILFKTEQSSAPDRDSQRWGVLVLLVLGCDAEACSVSCQVHRCL